MSIPPPPEDSSSVQSERKSEPKPLPVINQAGPKNIGGLGVIFYRLAGSVLLALGFIGLVLPVFPTTVFLIGAAACFARSSPRLHGYLMNHQKAGPPLRDWFDEGAIGSTGKAAALFGMGLGMMILVLTVSNPLVIWPAAAVLFASGWFVMSRPTPKREAPPTGSPPP